ncbi:helix-turn-helix domain-containing protein [Frondihabitans cladoniiphilus]|uniref:HTH cro/C1-type domain-containing protein n=1 Tax=Frondihabitans cladoniiphilus TaxID=715785 RepID=A0ABP8WFL4_9MICO
MINLRAGGGADPDSRPTDEVHISGNEAADALQEALAAELRGALAIANIKVRAWARLAAVSHDSIYRILRGQRPVTVVELIMLCRALGEDPFDLITRASRRAELPNGPQSFLGRA